MDVITLSPHPLLRVRAFTTRFPAPLASLPTAPAAALLDLSAHAPLERDETVRQAVRDMLRHAGYKPTGRGKPASEYLVRAAAEYGLTSINPAVDACNAASLHSGLPISVIDLDRAEPPLHIAPGSPADRYVFNPSGQEIDVGGLVCLCDAAGPCANAVKDAQRTKTTGETTRTLSVIWGVAGHEPRLDATHAWYRALLQAMGAVTADVAVR